MFLRPLARDRLLAGTANSLQTALETQETVVQIPSADHVTLGKSPHPSKALEHGTEQSLLNQVAAWTGGDYRGERSAEPGTQQAFVEHLLYIPPPPRIDSGSPKRSTKSWWFRSLGEVCSPVFSQEASPSGDN